MTCQDNCLYYPLCRDSGFLMYHTRMAKTLTLTENVESECPFKKFKNKDDFAEVRHGEWKVVSITGAKRKLRCNQCGYFRETHPGESFPKICEKCGAVMDGRGDT